MTKERIEELRVFLLTLNGEGWAPKRKSWADDIGDLLALLDEKAASLAAGQASQPQEGEDEFATRQLLDHLQFLGSENISCAKEPCPYCEAIRARLSAPARPRVSRADISRLLDGWLGYPREKQTDDIEAVQKWLREIGVAVGEEK